MWRNSANAAGGEVQVFQLWLLRACDEVHAAREHGEESSSDRRQNFTRWTTSYGHAEESCGIFAAADEEQNIFRRQTRYLARLHRG